MFFRWLGFVFEFPPETAEVVKFGNRLLDFLEARQQTEVDAALARLKATNDRLAAKLNQSQ